MAPTLLDRLDGIPTSGDGWPRPSILERLREPHPASRGGELTLEQLLVSAWEGITADRTAPCPICRGAMTPRFGSGPGPVAARCTDCGTELE